MATHRNLGEEVSVVFEHANLAVGERVQKGWSVEDIAAPCRRVDGIFDATIRLRQNGGENRS
jgi:hypothetical protein